MNENKRDGGLGSLCWARWEVTRHLIDGVSTVRGPDGEGRARQAIDRLRGSLDDIEAALEEASEGLPAELAEFHERFRTDAARAPAAFDRRDRAEAVLAELGATFDFGSYPQIEAYGERAATHPACRRP